jgi:hypothetical protein
MTTKISLISASPRFILVITAGVTIATCLLGWHFNLDRNQWPGWVQAVGSVLAILVAVWVSWQQADSQQRREAQNAEDELHGLISAIKTEIETNSANAHDAIGKHLLTLSPGTHFNGIMPISEDPFDIYNAALPKLGLIRDPELRAQIVRTYSLAKGFVLTLRYHNALVENLETAQIEHELGPTQNTSSRIRILKAELVGYTQVLCGTYKKMNLATDTLLPMLEAY